MPAKIYIDGQAGTTALRIRDWLAGRNDLEVVTLPEELRKDPAARKKALQDATHRAALPSRRRGEGSRGMACRLAGANS